MASSIESNIIINRNIVRIVDEHTALVGIENYVFGYQGRSRARLVKMNGISTKNSFLAKVFKLDPLNGLDHMRCVVDD